MAEETGVVGQGGTGGEGGVGEAIASQVQDALSEYLPAAEGGEGGKKEGEEGAKSGGEGGEGAGKEEGEHKEGAAPPAEGAEGKEPGAEVKALQDQIKALSEKLEALSKPKEEGKPKEEKPLITKYFNNQAEYEAAFEKPESMEAVLNKVKADAKSEAVEEVVKNIPRVVTNLVKTQLTMMKSVDKFYTDNPNLSDKREFVAHVANELMGKNPGWSVKKLFTEELGKEVNRRLGAKPGSGQPKEQGKSPGQAPKPSASRKPAGKTPELEPLQKEILDIVM